MFDFVVYFAAWIKSEISPDKRVFAKYDQKLLDCAQTSNSLQEALVRVVGEIIGLNNFKKPFLGGVNGVLSFLT